MNYKHEFERLLAVAKQFTDCGKGNVKLGALAPFAALKNAVNYYETEPGVEANGLKRCHVCMNVGYTARFCHQCGREANPPAP